MASGFRTWTFGSRLYDLSLGTTSTPPSERTPPNPWLGTSGGYGSGAADFDRPPEMFWPRAGAAGTTGTRRGAASSYQNHDFDWLNHRPAPEAPLMTAERGFFEYWLASFDGWHEGIWGLEILADRLINWLVYYPFITANAAPEFVRACNISLNRQARHLMRCTARPDLGVDRLTSLHGAVLCALSLPALNAQAGARLQALGVEIDRQVNADGGHRDRNPERHLCALARLIHVRQALFRAQMEVPTAIQNAIDRMTPVLRAYRHGDGGLALFNGGGEGDPVFIRRIVELSGSRGRTASSVPHTGFQRLATQRSSIIMDAGAPMPGTAVPGHAGALAFEMSVGKQRVVVNCGGHADMDPRLAEVMRGTAAHSTLVIGDMHSSELDADLGFGERRARDVRAQRREIERNIVVEASHDGYAEALRLVHKRSLYLSAEGDDIRGEDTISGPGGTGFAIRFHLHPDVQASLISSGAAVLMRFGRNRGWRFQASGGSLTLDDSLYFGGGRRRKTQQIVITGTHAPSETTIKWRFHEEIH